MHEAPMSRRGVPRIRVPLDDADAALVEDDGFVADIVGPVLASKSARDRRIIGLRAVGYELGEIAAEYHISPSRVSLIFHQALSDIRRAAA